jgi:hypothetical protein
LANSFIATYDTPAEAASAVQSLVGAGFDRAAITVMSAEPIQLGEPSEEHKNHMGWVALGGGIVGAVAAILLTTETSQNIGVKVGGMPIVAPWAFGIIVFEMTALGAIVSLFLKTILEAKLGRPRALVDYDVAVADGKIAVAVACADDEESSRASQIVAASADENANT